MSVHTIDANEFLEVVRPVLAKGDAAALAQVVQVRWQPRQLCQLLKHAQGDVRRVVAFTLGLVGDNTCEGCLTRALHDNDWRVNEMAEHALWSIWFRSGDPKAAMPFRQGVALLADSAYEPAIRCFHQAFRIDPDFAEAYNQCALAHYFLGRWQASIDAARLAVRRVPVHFGAFAGMGHCYTQLGNLERAVHCYRRALRINPRMPAIARAIDQLSVKLHDICDSSGQYVLDPVSL